MEKIKIGASDQLYEITSIAPESANVLRIVFDNDVPLAWGGSIELYTAGGDLATALAGYDTVCAVDGQAVYLSNDGQVHPVPEQPDKQPATPYWLQMSKQVADLEVKLTEAQLALAEQYEENIMLQDELTNTQLALTELFEGMGV